MFDKIVGNQKIIDTLEKSVKQDKTSHSYLFVGIPGIGKRLVAIELAKMLLCLDDNKYCNKCKSCIEFDTNNNPDYVYIEPDGNNIKIEQIRNLQKSIQEKPIISTRKVFIINDADLMTKEAQNCLLKTLEEPPKFSTIILVGSNETAFLPTIKSRCTILYFNKINDQQIKEYLKEHYNIESINPNMLEMFQGSIGKALVLKDKQEIYKTLESIVEDMKQRDLIDIINDAEILYKSKEEIQDMLEYLNIILLRKSKQASLYTNCIKIVENTKKRLKQNANYDMTIDDMLFKMWEELV